MQINCVITTNSLKLSERIRCRKKTICKCHILPYMPENNARCKLEKIRRIKEVLNTSIAQC